MNRCLITYESISIGNYSKKGLSKLSPRLTILKNLPFTAVEQRREAAARATKISIQGFQAKFSAKLSIKNQSLEITDKGGTYIIKPQNDLYPQLPENEDLTMKMAGIVGIETPLTGLVQSKDGSFSYFIKRFDRYGKNKKYHQEDFAQLTENSRDTKYKWSMEKLAPVLEYCTFPSLERLKLFRRVIFCFLTGNEDMHLKNFSLITREGKITLSPAYDLLNSTIVLPGSEEEMALPLAGKKKKFKRQDLIDYFGKERLKLTEKSIEAELENFLKTRKKLEELIKISFLSEELKEKYFQILSNRYQRLGV